MSKLLRTGFLMAILAFTTAFSHSASAAIKIDISTYNLVFGQVAVGAKGDEVLVITNEASSTGNAVIQLHPPTTSYYTIIGGWDPITLTPGESRSITIEFSPTCTCILDDAIIITDNGDGTTSNNPATVELTGQGTVGGNPVDTTLKVGFTDSFSTPNTINFGDIPLGTQGTIIFSINNTSSSNTERTLNGTISTTNLPFSVTSGSGNYSLTSGNGDQITLVFNPTHLGSYFDSIVITSNADNPSYRRIVLYITGTATKALPTNDTSLVIGFNGTIPNSDYLDFGTINVGTYGTLTFVVDDASSNSTIRQLIGTVGTASAPFSVVAGSGTFVLNSGGMRVVTINFTPTANGIFTDSVVITSNADNASGRSITLHLHGIGANGSNGGGNGDSTAQINVSGLTQVLNFGNVSLGDIGYRYFTITNVSDKNNALIGTASKPSAPFALATGGTFNLAQGGQDPVFVSFTPTHLGQFYDSIVVNSNASAPGNHIVVYVVGTSGTSSGVETSQSLSAKLAAYPNPFSATNTLSLTLAKTSNVVVTVYNLIGQQVANLASGSFSAGTHTVEWNANGFRNGTYFYRVQVGSETKTLPVVLSR